MRFRIGWARVKFIADINPTCLEKNLNITVNSAGTFPTISLIFGQYNKMSLMGDKINSGINDIYDPKENSNNLKISLTKNEALYLRKLITRRTNYIPKQIDNYKEILWGKKAPAHLTHLTEVGKRKMGILLEALKQKLEAYRGILKALDAAEKGVKDASRNFNRATRS